MGDASVNVHFGNTTVQVTLRDEHHKKLFVNSVKLKKNNLRYKAKVEVLKEALSAKEAEKQILTEKLSEEAKERCKEKENAELQRLVLEANVEELESEIKRLNDDYEIGKKNNLLLVGEVRLLEIKVANMKKEAEETKEKYEWMMRAFAATIKHSLKKEKEASEYRKLSQQKVEMTPRSSSLEKRQFKVEMTPRRSSREKRQFKPYQTPISSPRPRKSRSL